MALQIRRGPTADRTGVVFLSGELAFDTDQKKLYVGDIAISYEIIKERSKKTNFSLEFDKVWIHGYLHLIGYDHKKLNEFKKMFRKEKSILRYFHKVN